jgi:hypothetical protein
MNRYDYLEEKILGYGLKHKRYSRVAVYYLGVS